MSEGRVVEQSDSLGMRKQSISGCIAMLERERKIAIRPLVTGSGVRVPHNPQLAVAYGMFSESRKRIHLIEEGYTARTKL
jgi:hypothetical protein